MRTTREGMHRFPSIQRWLAVAFPWVLERVVRSHPSRFCCAATSLVLPHTSDGNHSRSAIRKDGQGGSVTSLWHGWFPLNVERRHQQDTQSNTRGNQSHPERRTGQPARPEIGSPIDRFRQNMSDTAPHIGLRIRRNVGRFDDAQAHQCTFDLGRFIHRSRASDA